MPIPPKLLSGQNFKQATVRTVNNIIDYLKTQRLVSDGKTIKINQLCSGIALSVPSQGASRGGGGGVQQDFPFKLYTSIDQNNNPVICMQEGRILVQSTQSQPIAYRYETVPQGGGGSTPISAYIPVDWSSAQDGNYLIIGVLQAVIQSGQLHLQRCCLVTGGSINVQDIPCCEGYFTFYIGTVKKTTVQSESSSSSSSSGSPAQYTLDVVNNRITSDLIVDGWMQIRPFNVFATINHGQANVIKTAYTDWYVVSMYANNGVVYDDLTRQDISVSQQTIYVPSQGNNYLYLVLDAETGDIQLQWTTTAKDAYVYDENDQYIVQKNYQIAQVIIARNEIGIKQTIDNNIILNESDTYKIKVDNGDVDNQDKAPNYAVSKLYGDFGTLQGDTQSEYDGYIGVYEQANQFSEQSNDYALKWKWCYDEISNYSTSDYIQLNANSDSLSWQPAYRVRVNQADTSPGFLSSKLEAGSHIQLTTAFNMIGIDATPPNITGVSPIVVVQDLHTGWDFEISLDESDFVKEIIGTNCITATRSDNTVTLAADKACIFNNFTISGSSPITVSGSGQSWSIGFDDTGFLKSVVNGTCITSSRNGSSVTINVDKACVFQNFSITGDNYIGVSGSGQSWSLSFDDSGLVKTISAGTCISVSRSGSTATINVDKSCVFQNFSISGTSPITVSGSGQSWTIGINDSALVQTITSQDNTVSITRSGSTVDLSVPDIGKVKVDSLDSLGYLGTKFENSNDYINFQIGNKIQAELGPDAVQSDGSIDVDCTNGFALIDIDWNALIIDQSLAPLISKSVSNHVCTLSLNAPSNGKYVLMANNGSVSWVAVGQCPGEEQEQPGDAIPNVGDDPNENENDGEE